MSLTEKNVKGNHNLIAITFGFIYIYFVDFDRSALVVFRYRLWREAHWMDIK